MWCKRWTQEGRRFSTLQDPTQRAHPRAGGGHPFKDKMLAATAPLTEVGSSQYKSHFLPFFLSRVLLDRDKNQTSTFPTLRTWSTVDLLKKVPLLAAGTQYLSILRYICKLLTWPKNPWQMSSGKDLTLAKRKLHCKLGKLCPLVAAERSSASASSVFLGRN